MKLFIKISLCFWLILLGLTSFGQEIPERSNPPKLVNDFANILSAEQVANLEQKLVAFNKETSNQITIVIVSDLGGYDKADFAVRLGEKWGVGQKDKDNGAVFLIKPKNENGKGEAYLAIGYGLEGAIPDATSRHIVDNEAIPFFKKNDYYGGIEAATNTIMSLSKGEFTAEQYDKSGKKGSLITFIIIAVLFIVFSILGRRNKNNHHTMGGSGAGSIPFWMLMGGMNSGSSSGSFGGFSSGGGGFGGFGGGSFGGGGAGGSW